MTFKVNPRGRDWGSLVNWDDLGKLYAGIAIAWTVILYTGATWLFLHRRISFLKMRNIPLAIAAVSFLHVYLIKILLAYTTNGHFLCSAEFWIMSIYLPFGIALFQANVAQLQSVRDQQQRLLDGEHSISFGRRRNHPSGVKGMISKWQALPPTHKTYVLIGLGMLAQLIATAAIYGTSAKLQGHWPANLSHAKGQALCRKGLEWIPSSIWQLWWSCFYGPYLLYRVRNIKDLHYWRLQIVISVIAGFPGAPLWLASLYSPAFKPVNRRWVPPMWLAPGIFCVQAVTIFIPIYEAYESRSRLKTTLELIKTWDEKRQNDDSTLNSGSSSNHKSYFSHSAKSVSTAGRSVRSREMHTMAALEKALALNPIPLLHFAATKDFTGENIAFLMQVRHWHSAWNRFHNAGTELTEDARSRLYDLALEIYVSSIDEKTADFHINIEGKVKRELDRIFGAAASERRPYRDDSIADPFKDGPPSSSPHDPFATQSVPESALPKNVRSIVERANSGDTDPMLNNDSTEHMIALKESMFDANPCVRPPVKRRDAAAVMPDFNEHVFDEAERSIKYLVLTNTWQKFVMENNAVSP